MDSKNYLEEILHKEASVKDVIYIAKTEGLEIYSDIVSQKVICK
jgi:hypothetical protein